MRQLLQNINNGECYLEEVPVPTIKPGSVVIQSAKSLISPGTERMLLEFGKANYVQKALKQPDRVKQVLEKIKTDGLAETLDSVNAKLNSPMALGYSNAGIVIASGSSGYSVGDRVVSNGPHAEVVRVPENLCAKIPNNVSFDAASFTVLGSVALQGIRLAKPDLGETCVVIGLGLVGLLAVQILIANGCKVIAVDYSDARCDLAKSFGALVINGNQERLADVVTVETAGVGADFVIIAASTDSDQVIHESAAICRQRGRIVLVGVVGLNLRRDDFYKKEISFQVSASYGPGRYDYSYEEMAQDYPIGFVRWTANRNFRAVLSLLSKGALTVDRMISNDFDFSHIATNYESALAGDKLGVLVNYNIETEEAGSTSPEANRLDDTLLFIRTERSASTNDPTIGFLGAGAFATKVLIPAFSKAGANLKTLVSSGGLSSGFFGKRFGFEACSSDPRHILEDTSIDIVCIATPHDSHADLVLKALQSGKHVFVEKPLALRLDQLHKISSWISEENAKGHLVPQLLVGFNRRAAPHVLEIKRILAKQNAPKVVNMMINAGRGPADHWSQDYSIGGGRILGEFCHFADLARCIIDQPIRDITVQPITREGVQSYGDDSVIVVFYFEDGSVANISYLANGHKSFPKERIEIFCNGKIIVSNNFRVLRCYGVNSYSSRRSIRQDKGHMAFVRDFVSAIKDGQPVAIPLSELFDVSEDTIKIDDQFRKAKSSGA